MDRLIASGGMGTIHRAFDLLTRREVAYKRLRVAREALRPRLSALFQREYDTLAQLTHPNIVRVYDYGFDEFGPYYTMELLPGEDLTALAPMPYEQACRVLRQVASALALLHARRLVHRDVSPNNVRLTSAGRAKLIDFGALTSFGVPKEIVGTPTFVAPECLTKEPLDQRVDLYALGALAYWLLTGVQPYYVRALDELPAAWARPIPPPSRVAAVPSELDQLVMSLLQLDRQARPAGAADVIERLTRIADLPPEVDEREVTYSYLTHAPLVGREGELRALERALANALEGRGQVVWIEASAGLGRSALVDHVALQAQLAGATVLRADGGVHEGAFGIARHLTDRGLAAYPDAPVRLGDVTRVWLPAERSRKLQRVRSAIEAAERQARLSGALRERLLYLSQRSALVLLVDDAHRADSESLALLASMLDELREHPILLVLTSAAERAQRPTHARARLEAAATHLSLAPLSSEQVVELVETMFGDVPHARRVGLWAHGASGGNPAECMDLMRLLLRSGAIRYTLGTFTLPHDVDSDVTRSKDAALLTRLADLSQPATMTANLLALHGRSLTVRQLAAASGLEPRSVLLALEQLTSRGVATAAGDAFSLASESLSAALVRSIPPAIAQVLHTALGRALLDGKAHSLEHRLLAGHHLLRGGGERELEGAQLIADTTHEHVYEIGLSARFAPLLEAALEVHRKYGSSEEARLGLLAPLAASGFYGGLDVQRRHLEPTLEKYARLSGLALAKRLERWLGLKLAVIVGVLWAVLHWVTIGGRRPRTRVSKSIENFMAVASAGVAASASAFDDDAVRKLLAWLEPIAAFPRRSAASIVREFCLATAEIGTAKMASAAARYTQLLALLERPVLGLEDQVRAQLYYGCLHGRAQILASYGDSAALELADQLERGSAFLAPHAETVRVAYYAYRGERASADVHRARAEALALRGGTSWTAVTVLTLRWLHMCVLTGDVIGVVRAVAEFDRLARTCPSLARMRDLANAHLQLMRGRPDAALEIYARLLRAPGEARRSTDAFDCAMYAQALSELGRHDEARALCEALLAELTVDEGPTAPGSQLLVRRLALAELALGASARAAERLDEYLERAQPTHNPLALGLLHRARAQVALAAQHADEFEHHFQAMADWLRLTNHPWLLEQMEALHTQAVNAGLIARHVLSAELQLADSPGEGDPHGATIREEHAPCEPPTQITPVTRASATKLIGVGDERQ